MLIRSNNDFRDHRDEAEISRPVDALLQQTQHQDALNDHHEKLKKHSTQKRFGFIWVILRRLFKILT